jgi:2'-5' RNA ligase
VSAAGGGHTLGVTIEIPEPYGPELDSFRKRYSSEPDPMPAHVTILPPIDVDADVMAAVVAHLSEVAATTRPFRLRLRGSGTFRPVSPVVFVNVVDGIASCEQLERNVRSGDLAVESRFPYHPHVTVVHGAPEDELDRAFSDLADYSASMVISGMMLHEITDGEWTLVREFPFGG